MSPMPDALDTDKLRELHARATPGPWFWNSVGDDLNAEAPFDGKHFGSVGIMAEGDSGCDDVNCRRCCNSANGPLVALMFNSLPALLDLAARAERMEAVLRQFADCDLHDGNCASLEVASRRIRNLARTALALPAADRRAENDKHE